MATSVVYMKANEGPASTDTIVSFIRPTEAYVSVHVCCMDEKDRYKIRFISDRPIKSLPLFDVRRLLPRHVSIRMAAKNDVHPSFVTTNEGLPVEGLRSSGLQGTSAVGR